MSLLQSSAAVVLGVAIVGGGIGYVVHSHTSVASQNVVSHTTTGSSNVVQPKSPSTTTVRSLQQQVELLQKAVAPTNPGNAADAWAKGVQTRNGALQFAVLSPTLQSQMKNGYESWNWTPGASSPWVAKYSISTGRKVSDTSYKFVITYTWTDSTRNTTTSTSTIEVTKLHGNWYVSSTGGYGSPSSNAKALKSDSTTEASLQRLVQLLQKAVAPTSPRNAADTWAKGIETRNGALQFATLTPVLQKKMKNQYESWQWTTGTSSPWVKKFSISIGKKVSDTAYAFVITYTWTDSTDKTTNTTSTIEVTKLHGNWYISNMGNKGNQRLG